MSYFVGLWSGLRIRREVDLALTSNLLLERVSNFLPSRALV